MRLVEVTIKSDWCDCMTIDLAFLTDLTATLNDLNTELQGENKTTTKMTGTGWFFQRKLMKGALTHFPSIQSHTDDTFDASVYILCINRLLKEFEKRFKDYECMKFTVPFITNPLQQRNISERAKLISSVFKESISVSLATTYFVLNIITLLPLSFCGI